MNTTPYPLSDLEHPSNSIGGELAKLWLEMEDLRETEDIEDAKRKQKEKKKKLREKRGIPEDNLLPP